MPCGFVHPLISLSAQNAVRAAAHRHADGEDVDHQQMQDAADHRHMAGDVLDMVDDQDCVGFARERRLAGCDRDDGSTPLARHVGHCDHFLQAAAAADHHNDIAWLEHTGCQQLQARVGVGGTRHAEAQEFELRILRHDAVMPDRIELDPAGMQQQIDRAVDHFAVQLAAYLQDRRGCVAQHLGAQLDHRIVQVDLGMSDRHGAGQARCQAQLEVRQPGATERAAKADHGWLADLGSAGNFHDRIVEHRARMRQHIVCDPGFCG